VSAAVIGQVGGTRLAMAPWIDAPVETLSDAWRTGLERAARSTRHEDNGS